MLADYHVHTPYCGHARGKLIDYIDAAVACGLQEIGFADHLGRYYLTSTQRRRYWDWGMDQRNVARYVAELLELRELYQDRIAVRIGLEVDYVEGAEEILEPIISQYPFDFLLCSVHCIPRFGWKHLADYSKSPDSEVIYKEYFRLCRTALQSGLFHVLAHMDFVWRYISWPRREPSMPFEEIAETVRAAKAAGRAIEINANGYLWSRENTVSGGNPFDTLIAECCRSQTPVSLGSDAHDPAMVGKCFADLSAALKEKNITSISSFSEGKLLSQPLG
jgi:histidinol-phosphatase (PHP family)